MSEVSKKFKSCYVSDVEITNQQIILKDCSNNMFIIFTDDEELVKQFKLWFKHIYLECIPQVLTVFEYEIVEKNEFEVIQKVKNIRFNNNVLKKDNIKA
jgi:hypothetical protein